MVLLPEEAELSLAELRQMAARQQHQIEAQQQLLVAKEQRLKFLKQQEARHSHRQPSLDQGFLQDLRGRVDAQDHRLRQLRALRAQVDQQKTNNGNLGAELDSIRALFSEKEKELNLAVNKVDELSRQLEEIRLNKNRKNCAVSTTAAELDNLRRELMYRTKMSEQQNAVIGQQREDISGRQQDIANLDHKINDLTQRLHRKRLLNQQLASHIHSAQVAKTQIHDNDAFGSNHSPTVVTIEPLPRDIPDTQDDMAAKLSNRAHNDEFTLTKNDPKYQTLPYNTKFTLRGKTEDSSTEDDSYPNSLDSASRNKVCNAKPFNGALNAKDMADMNENNNNSLKADIYKTKDKADCQNNNVVDQQLQNISTTQLQPIERSKSKPINPPVIKPAVPPKPALPVKPMMSNRQNHIKVSDLSNEKDVSAALSLLQKKSSINEKSAISKYRSRLLYYQCVPRYSHKNHDPQPQNSKSKLSTYFKKLESSEPLQNGNIDSSSVPKRKTSVGILPIKPKPLTIRKTPGLEPPKLKTQTSISNFQRKTSDSNLLKTKDVPANGESSKGSEVVPVKVNDSDATEKVLEKVTVAVEEVEKCEAADEVDRVNPVICISRELTAEVTPPEIKAPEEKPPESSMSALQRIIHKGNLKVEKSVSRSSRRVSFDPLALLLDAALEGELELVKKTATEVPNPSSANDEGITALHNAICAGHFDVVTFLVEYGCDVNAQDSDGWTPLHCAASCNNLDVVKFLVEKGACVFATTLSDQETAAEKCEEDEAGFDGCSEYLFSLQENLGTTNCGAVFAVYDYEGENADELSFRNGDCLTVLRKETDDEQEWWWARRHDTEGFVPRNLLGLYPRVQSCRDQDPTE